MSEGLVRLPGRQATEGYSFSYLDGDEDGADDLGPAAWRARYGYQGAGPWATP
jgi:hypothetical protein